MELIDRISLATQFVDNILGKATYSMVALPGDAGFRKYFRISKQDTKYILMDCPPDYTCLNPFVAICSHIHKIGLTSPTIYHTDITNGFLLIEDFGSLKAKDHIITLLSQNNGPKLVEEFYKKSLDELVILQNHAPLGDLKFYTNELLLSELDLFLDLYLPQQKVAITPKEREEFKIIWHAILQLRPSFAEVFVHRDYHVENIMVMTKEGQEKLGLIDFQDALIGSPIYDLVSILEDARIKVDRKLALNLVNYYSQCKNFDIDKVMLEYAILGAQRNLRILGVFARKALRDNDYKYLEFMPLVLEYLKFDTSPTELQNLRDWLEARISL